jgi:hypothetical protein
VPRGPQGQKRSAAEELDAIEELHGLKSLLHDLERGGKTIVQDGVDLTQTTIEALKRDVAQLEEIVSRFPKGRKDG